MAYNRFLHANIAGDLFVAFLNSDIDVSHMGFLVNMGGSHAVIPMYRQAFKKQLGYFFFNCGVYVENEEVAYPPFLGECRYKTPITHPGNRQGIKHPPNFFPTQVIHLAEKEQSFCLHATSLRYQFL